MQAEEFKSGVYRHYKGPHYLALGLAREDETDELVVVYVRLYARGGVPMSTRKLRVWCESVQGADGVRVPRFEWVGQTTPQA